MRWIKRGGREWGLRPSLKLAVIVRVWGRGARLPTPSPIGPWAVDSGQFTVDSGQWTLGSGQWEWAVGVGSGQWAKGSGQ